MVKLIINGASGAMGRVIAQCAKCFPEEYRVVAGIVKGGEVFSSPDFPVFDNWESCDVQGDVILDFSMPEALVGVLSLGKRQGAGVVIGTTGLKPADRELMAEAAKEIPVFTATNMSLGVNLQLDLVKRAASFLGDKFDVEIVERHHHNKVDAPSGTALSIANALKEQYSGGKELVFDRHDVRRKRDVREIGMHSVRGGTIVGDHDVMFIGEDEILQVTHSARSKKVFAMGALRAATFIYGREPRVYSMGEIFADLNSLTDVEAIEGQSIVTISHLPYDHKAIADVFDAIASAGINLDMISQTAPVAHSVDLSFTLPDASLSSALAALEPMELRIDATSGLTKFSVEGFGMEHRPGIAARMFRVLSDADVKVKLVTTSETKISYCIESGDLSRAMAATKDTFGL